MSTNEGVKRANRRSAEQGEPTGVDFTAVRKQLEELKERQQRLEAILEKVDAKGIAENSFDIPNHALSSQTLPREPKNRPLRTDILDALQDLEWPAYSRELALYCQARYGRTIAPTRFGTLAADEEKAYRRPGRRPRPLWLSFALTFDRHQPIKRLLARSDWPLSMRIVAPTTGRIQHLWMTRRLCDLALEVGETAADPEMLKIIAADHAKDVLGVKVRRGEFDLMGWREAAEAKLTALLPEDEQLRQESADRLALRPERVQLFGIPEVIEGGRVDVGRKRDRA